MEDGQERQQSDVRDSPRQLGTSGTAETQQSASQKGGHATDEQRPAAGQQQTALQASRQHSGHQRQRSVETPQLPPPFPSQLPPLHHGPYDMSPMAHVLPNFDYRQHHHHQQQHQTFGPGMPRFSVVGSQPPGRLRGPVVPYGGHMDTGQPYFYSQQSPGQPILYYDGHGPSIHGPSPAPNTLPRQHGYSYYPPPGPPPTSYYYPPSSPIYSPPSQGLQQQMPPAYPPTRPLQPRAMPGSGHQESRMASQKGAAALQKSGRRQSQGQTEARTSSIIPGPPRKPKQSGHAIWIGNLPPQTNLMSLVHHVCQKTVGLESLFLIPKSNCAFANFQDEQACLTAQQSLHDTWFASARLVTRLRKSPAEAAQGPTGEERTADDAEGGPAAASTTTATAVRDDGEEVESPKTTSPPAGVIVNGSNETSRAVPPASGSDTAAGRRGDRFFILKSLTVEDLERSVQTGVWATQAHNEETLNGAFKSSQNVYLIFSANKSGEYFGYARMLSEINPDPAAAIALAPKQPQALNDADQPQAIPTEATATTPRGRIIDDSARGTLFWEALREEEADNDDDDDNNDNNDNEPRGVADGETEETEVADSTAATAAADEEATTRARNSSTTKSDGGARRRQSLSSPSSSAAYDEAAPQAWGKPFRLVWVSTAKLPFYRTRGMRNPLNANREVKIARDGTEVDAAVGRKLLGLFHEAAAAGGLGGPGPFVPSVPPSPY